MCPRPGRLWAHPAAASCRSASARTPGAACCAHHLQPQHRKVRAASIHYSKRGMFSAVSHRLPVQHSVTKWAPGWPQAHADIPDIQWVCFLCIRWVRRDSCLPYPDCAVACSTTHVVAVTGSPGAPSPDNTPTFFCWSPLLKLYHEQYARVLTLRPLRSTSSDPPLMVSYTCSQFRRETRHETSLAN